jgi:hypothetical protein
MPLLRLVLRYQRPSPPDLRRLDLRDAGILVRLDQRREQGLVKFGAD